MQIILAIGASYAAVLLYHMLCTTTRFASTSVIGKGCFGAEHLVPVKGTKRIKVHFNANRSRQLP
jgi:cytochrome c oxidase assembly protein subunit 11